jgi:hypothetical protein
MFIPHADDELDLNQDSKNQVSAETVELFQVGNQEIKLPPAVLNFDLFPMGKSKRRENAAVSSRTGAEIKRGPPLIYINNFFCDDRQVFPGFFAGKNQNNQNNQTRRGNCEISRNRLMKGE